MEDYNDTVGYNQNPYTESYFVENEDVDELQYIDYICKKQHLNYHTIPYNNSLRSYKRARTKYIEEINNWLDSPLRNMNGVVFRTNTYIDSEMDSDTNMDSDMKMDMDSDSDTNQQHNYSIMKNVDIIEHLYNNILFELEKNNYKIKDLNQFKEDLIHYVYILSDIDR